ncbi:MAG: FeoB-associated Cys-rich membrane protein [Clostridium sp.]|nr:FeoB-associated Cys-rich membrane protein [Clostridium sp.]
MGTVIAGVVVLLIVLFSIKTIRKDKKNGKSCSCGCECKNCAGSSMCHSK